MREHKHKEVPLFFHNATYDVNLFMKYIGSEKMFGEERYWKLSMVGQNIKFICADIISIKDSYTLQPMPLNDLGRQEKRASASTKENTVNASTGSGGKVYTHTSGCAPFVEWTNATSLQSKHSKIIWVIKYSTTITQKLWSFSTSTAQHLETTDKTC